MSRGKPQSQKQRAVREGAFQRTLDEFNEAIGQKMARSMYEYHTTNVEPRLAHLELPFYKRWAIDFKKGFHVLGIKAWILISWHKTYEEIEGGWQEKWYQGVARKDDERGFVFVLKPFNHIVRFWDLYRDRRWRRKQLRAKEKAAEEGEDG